MLGLALVALAVGTAPVSAQSPANIARRSVVWIVTPDASGSGFLIDRQRGLIVTASHVIRGASSIRVVFPAYQQGQLVTTPQWYSNRRDTIGIPGKVVRVTTERDLAIIQLGNPSGIPAHARVVQLARYEPGPGTRLHLVSGEPTTRQTAFAHIRGTVSGVRWRASTNNTGGTRARRVILSNLPNQPGNSGTLVVNNRGDLVGVHVSRIQGTHTAVSVVVSQVRPFIQPGLGTEMATAWRLGRCCAKNRLNQLSRLRR
jgi:S1-C subfamily serine protease